MSSQRKSSYSGFISGGNKVDGKILPASPGNLRIHIQGLPTYASRFIHALISATSKLQTLPHCGRMVPELEDSGLREVLYQNYRIVYRTSAGEDTVEILAVIHGARDLKKAITAEWIL